MTNAQAITVFLKAFAHVRSFTRPAEVVRMGAMQIVRDVERDDGKARAEELFFLHKNAGHSIAEVKAYVCHNRYRLCVFHPASESVEAVRAEYRAPGYRPRMIETLFTRDLDDLPAPARRPTVIRVTSQAHAQKIRDLTGRWVIRPQDWENPRNLVRAYYVEEKGKPVSYVRAVHLSKTASYVAGLYTARAHRRKGYATALMHHMLRDDRAAGASQSVLIASSSGAKLYPLLGYQERLVMQIFTPIRKT